MRELVVRNGLGLDDWLGDLVGDTGTQAPVVALGDDLPGVTLLAGRGAGRGRQPAPVDERRLRLGRTSARIADALIAVDPDGAATYRANLDGLPGAAGDARRVRERPARRHPRGEPDGRLVPRRVPVLRRRLRADDRRHRRRRARAGSERRPDRRARVARSARAASRRSSPRRSSTRTSSTRSPRRRARPSCPTCTRTAWATRRRTPTRASCAGTWTGWSPRSAADLGDQAPAAASSPIAAASSAAVGIPSRAPARVTESDAATTARRAACLEVEAAREARGERAVERVPGARGVHRLHLRGARCRPPRRRAARAPPPTSRARRGTRGRRPDPRTSSRAASTRTGPCPRCRAWAGRTGASRPPRAGRARRGSASRRPPG